MSKYYSQIEKKDGDVIYTPIARRGFGSCSRFEVKHHYIWAGEEETQTYAIDVLGKNSYGEYQRTQFAADKDLTKEEVDCIIKAIKEDKIKLYDSPSTCYPHLSWDRIEEICK